VRGEIERLLAQELEGEYGRFRAEALAAEVLGFWEGAGLLDVYRLAGQEWLAFRHLTFQEYGAARALAEMHRDDAEELWQCLSPHLLRPQWAGLTSLVLAHLPGALATTLVERLLAANAGDEDRQRPLFLAAAALAEGAEVADGSHRRVVDRLLWIAKTWGLWGSREKASAWDAVGALGRLVGDEHAAAGLLTLARDQAVEDGVRAWAVVALGELGRAEEAAEILLTLARDQAVEDGVRAWAVVALGELGRAEEAAEAWLALARDQAVETLVQEKAAEALGRLGRAEELFGLARDEAVEVWVRRWAAKALGGLGQATPEVLAGLRALAEEPDTPESVRRAARWALERLEG